MTKSQLWLAGRNEEQRKRLDDRDAAHRLAHRAEILLSQKRSRIKRTYGISLEELEQMKRDQRDRCLLCGEKKPLVVDHDHATGKVRGLLCVKCNCSIAILDNQQLLNRANEYLRSHHGK